jgi:hypothetical protein
MSEENKPMSEAQKKALYALLVKLYNRRHTESFHVYHLLSDMQKETGKKPSQALQGIVLATEEGMLIENEKNFTFTLNREYQW